MKKLLFITIVLSLILSPLGISASAIDLEILILKLKIKVLQLQVQQLLILLNESYIARALPKIVIQEPETFIYTTGEIIGTTGTFPYIEPIFSEELATTPEDVVWEDPQTKGCRTVEEHEIIVAQGNATGCPSRNGICICR